MKTTYTFMAILLAAGSWANAQVVPEATGPGGLPVSGDLHYALRYSQRAGFYGANQGNQQSSIASGDLTYSHANTRLPFSVDYGGGYIWSISGPSLGTGEFQHLYISQGLIGRKWAINVSDDVNYTPQSPTTGFSGVPGTGESIGGTNPAPPSPESILTLNTRTLSNNANGSFDVKLDYATSLSFGGGSILLRYPDGNGLDTDGEHGNAGITRRLNGRNSLTGEYVYGRYSYSGLNFSTDNDTALFGFERAWSRQLKTNVSIGPQWINTSDTTVEPASKTLAANASVNYMFKTESATLGYKRGANSGAGVLVGATVDSVYAGFTREFQKNLTVGVTGSYQRTSELQTGAGVTNARYGGVQANRRFGRYINLFVNYTAIDQSSSLAPATNVLNQLYQVVGFGIAYSPRDIHLKQ